jgi:hypothetical protein
VRVIRSLAVFFCVISKSFVPQFVFYEARQLAGHGFAAAAALLLFAAAEQSESGGTLYPRQIRTISSVLFVCSTLVQSLVQSFPSQSVVFSRVIQDKKNKPSLRESLQLRDARHNVHRKSCHGSCAE